MFESFRGKLYEPAGLWYQGGALIYTVAAYSLGWIGLFRSSWAKSPLGLTAGPWSSTLPGRRP